MKEKFPRGIIVSAVLLSVLAMQICAFAATWVGGQSDDWNDPANWSPVGGGPLPPLPADEGHLIGTSKTNYWPVIYNNHYDGSSIVPGPDADGFNAYSGLLSMSEWSGYSQLTFDGGVLYMSANAYVIVGRHTGDTALLTIESGGIGAYMTPPGGALDVYGATRWLRIGRGDSTGGGLGTMIMNGGKVYAQAMSVGNSDGTGDGGSSATINDGAQLYVGCNFIEASFDIGPTASMTINPGGYVKMFGDRLKGNANEENQYVWAKGALNLVADASGSARLIVPAWIETAAQLKGYFGYYDGETLIPGNVNAIYNGGAGQFVFSYPGGNYTEITVIPEPASMLLLGLGGLALIRRKL